MIVSKENCAGCSYFEENKFQENMIKNNICHRRTGGACERDGQIN